MTEIQKLGMNVKDIMSFADTCKEKKDSIRAPRIKEEKTVTYEFSASGIDFTMTRVLNGKPRKTLAVLLSKTDNEGRPQIFFIENNMKELYTVNKMVSFMDGVRSELRTGSTSIPKIPTDKKPFAEFIMELMDHKELIDLVRMGLIDLNIVYELETERSWRSNLRNPWYCTDWYNGTRFNNESIDRKNLHLKLAKAAIGYNMRNGLSYHEALRRLYSSESYRYDAVKSINSYEMEFFLVLANRYDEPFAIKCMEEYMDNDILKGLNANNIDEMLRMSKPKQAGPDDSYYYNDVSGSLVRRRLTPEEEGKVINFEKNRLWEYIEHSIAVGMGKNISNYLNLWKDYIDMSRKLGDVKDKYPEVIQLAHDLVVDRYNVSHDDMLRTKLEKATETASKICDVDVKDDKGDMWQFRILRTAVEFSVEAAQQSNCVASYMERCSNGRTLVGSLRPKGSDTTVVTVEVSIDGRYDFKQVKERFNHEPSAENKRILDKVQMAIYKNRDKADKDNEEEKKE